MGEASGCADNTEKSHTVGSSPHIPTHRGAQVTPAQFG
jgi:hypothetical protein